MFSDDVLIKYFTDEEIRKMPVDIQSSALHAIERILDEEERSKRNATISNLAELSNTL